MIKIAKNIYEIEIKDIKDLFKERDVNSHKGIFGTVGILGGSQEYSGAIKLANMSAASLRSGCGITRVIVPETLANVISPYLLEQTLYPLKYNQDDKIEEKDLEKSLFNLKAIAIGMGWNQQLTNKKILTKIINYFQGPILIDADGLNTLSQMNLNILKKSHNKIILTPHLKEFSRLTNLSIEKIKKDALNVTRNFAKKYNIILLLKGHETIITDGKTTYITKTGGAGMATAGSGDVLSGIIIGMLGYNKANILTVASASFLAGLAGEFAESDNTDIAMIASDTINNISKAIKYIRKH